MLAAANKVISNGRAWWQAASANHCLPEDQLARIEALGGQMIAERDELVTKTR
jgi:hypothetical protein